MIEISELLVLGAVMFCISMAGIFLNRKNVIILLMSIELMLLSVNINFIAFSHYLQDLAGQVFVFFILTVAAAEAAIGLAILVVLFRNRSTIKRIHNMQIFVTTVEKFVFVHKEIPVDEKVKYHSNF